MGGIWRLLIFLFVLIAVPGHAKCEGPLSGLTTPAGMSERQMEILGRLQMNAPLIKSLEAAGSDLRVASIQDLLKVVKATELELRRGQLRYDGQILLPAVSADDLDLLVASDLDHNPRESFLVILKLSTGESFKSEIRSGGPATIDGALIKTSLNEALGRAQNSLSESEDRSIAAFVFSHTHTVPDLYLPGTNKLLPSPLSPLDKALGSEISKLFPGVPVIIKAVLQNGYTYQLIFKNGEIQDI
jgi:hypothetical protein